jgi:microsomal dipeptidase-like Zn-dependent dipeptidase
MNKIRHYRAELLWNQVQHIAELLDRNNLPAWDCMAIGSDFDGIINPLNGFLTAETFVHLEEYLERYAYNYMQDAGKKLQSYNQISADKIVHRIFHSNGLDFLQRVF